MAPPAAAGRRRCAAAALAVAMALLALAPGARLAAGRPDKETREKFYGSLVANGTRNATAGDDSIADMFGRVLDKEFSDSDATEVPDKNSFNNSISDHQAVLETVAVITHDKKNDTQQANSSRPFQIGDMFGSQNENSDDTETVIDKEDNVFVMSNRKTKYPTLQLDLRLIKDLVVIIVSATAGGIIFSCLGQPVIVGYLLAGSLVGPGGLNLINELVQVETFAQFGVVFLLFALGLEFSLPKLKVVGPVAVLGGVLQIALFMFLCGLTAALCGAKLSEGVFVGTFLSMSSTAVVSKFLVEKGSTNALHGQVTIGTLILQDCAVGLLFALIPVLGGSSGIFGGMMSMGRLLLVLSIFVTVAYMMTWSFIPRFLKLMIQLSSQTNELYQLAAVAFCLLLAWCSDYLGLSLELGSFLAGVMISTTDFAHHTLEQVEAIRNLFAQSLELLLIQFLMPDNDARRQAEEQIRRLARDPQVVPALVHHLRTAKTPNVRQLAAVLLRKKITSHWPKLPPHAKASLKQALIDSITLDNSHLVRRASANVVSIIAKYAVPAGEWQELLPFLFECSQSPQEEHREVALILFSSLTETIGTTFQSHLNDLQPILLKCLQDETSSRVRIAALKAVGSFIEYVNEGGNIVKMFRDFIPSILNVSRQCLANGDDDVASIAFEIFDELIESPAPLLGDSVRSIVQFSLEVCSNQDMEINIRQQAIQIISWLVKFKASFLKKNKLIVPILQVMCPLLTETANEDEDSDLAADRSAAEVIDTMAINLPRHVFGPVLEFASVNFRHINPKYREAAVTSLGVVSEGCSEHFKDKLEECLKVVLEALKDQEQMVRGAASFALGQFAEHLQPEILSHYESVLPCILNALEDPSDEVKEKSYYALAAFCEDMGEDILPYLEPLICRLVISLQSSPRNLQETCMSAIGSVAAAAEQAFIPYAEKVLEMMKGFMVLTKDEDLCARARATEVVGIVAMAVGRTRMEAILPPFIEAAISGFGLDYSELREYTHGFFSNIAEILDDSFSQYLPHVVPLAFSSCNLDDGSAVDIDDADGVDNGFSGVSSDDDDDEPRVRNISVRTGVLDEKAAATQAIGFFALHTKSAYAPYLEESLKILIKHSGYFHEDVRLQAIISLKHILTALRAIPAHPDILEKQKDVLDTIMNIYIKTMTEDDDKEVVAQACMSVADIMKDCGFAAVELYVPRLAEATVALLHQESCCQQVESDGEDDGDIDHDEVLMDAVSDLLPAFAKVMRSYFDPIFAKLFDPLMKYAKSPHPPQDKTMVVATLAEVAQEMGAPISAYVDKIMPLALKELASSEATNRRNAAFCVGELCKNSGAAALKYYPDILQGLHRLFASSEPDLAVRDNAAGAIARMIMVQPQSIPLNQVLPVFIKALPLKEDHEESMAVYSCLCNLLLSSHPQILTLVPDVIHVFAQVVVSPDESDEVKTTIGKAVSHLISVYGQQMQPILSALPPAHANALAAFASRR